VTLSINKWLILAILVGVVVLAFALIRGCKNGKRAAALVVNSDSLTNKLKKDNIDLTRQLAANADTTQFLEGQLSLSHNKEIALNENLDKANARITNLLSKHVPIKPSPYDTGSTVVPNDYIVDCHDCFEELGNGQQLVRKYKAEKDNQEQIYKGQLNVKDNRINHLEKANKEVTSSYMALIDITKDAGKPKGRMYLSWGVLWKNYVPWAAGGGLMYQNKRSVIFGASWYYNSQGHMVQSNVHFPLSLKRK
jgi:hypothetical protein